MILAEAIGSKNESHPKKLVSTQCKPVLGVSELCISHMCTVLKNIRKNVFKNLTEMLLFPYRSDVVK